MLDARVRALCAQVALETDHKKCEALIIRLADLMARRESRTGSGLEPVREVYDYKMDKKV